MACLLKCIVILLHNPQPLSPSKYVKNPKLQLGPTDSFYPTQLSSYDIATATNPSHFSLTDRDLGLTEMGLQTLCFPS